jgi:DNA-directed RNA polymerase specialized sigma24 family protein
VARALTRDLHSAEDLCQETMVGVWIRWSRPEFRQLPEEEQRKWAQRRLRWIHRNECRGNARRARRQLEYAECRGGLGTVADPWGEVWSEMWINALPFTERRIIDLRLDGHSNDEIAGLTGTSPRTVSYRVARLRDRWP